MCCKVDKCCFCIDLRKGVIALACICLVLDLLLLILMSSLSYYISAAENYDWHQLKPEEREMFFNFIAVAFWTTTAAAVTTSVAVFLDVMLLAGAIKAQLKVLHGWKTAYAVVYAFWLLTYGMNIAWDIFHRSIVFGLLFTVCIILYAGMMLYVWIVVRSYCLQLGSKYGEGGFGYKGGRVYHKGGVLPPQATYCYADSTVMAPATQQCYTISS